MFGIIKKMFVVLFATIVSASNHIKCVSLSNQKCMTLSILINLHPDEYSQELHYYHFAINLDRRAGSCNTLDDLSNKVCAPNEREDLNHVQDDYRNKLIENIKKAYIMQM